MQLWQEADSPYLPHQCLMIDMYDWISLTSFEYSDQKTLFQFYFYFVKSVVLFLWKYEICLWSLIMTENYTLLFHGQWAPFHAVTATPLLVAFELLLCIYLQHSYGTQRTPWMHNHQKILLGCLLNHFIYNNYFFVLTFLFGMGISLVNWSLSHWIESSGSFFKTE